MISDWKCIQNTKPNPENLIAGDACEFPAQIVHSLRSESLGDRLAANTRLLLEQRHNWDQIGEQFVALVEEVAKRQGRDPGRDHAD